ncbi:MAG: hypothetical protein KH936_04170, partial [Neisseria sp.]|nr:hypothetical protein [Neisseria sp.]
NIEQKVGKIRKVLHFENEIEHKILVTYVIAKVSIGVYGSECHRRGKAAAVDSVSLDEMVEVICSQSGRYVWENQYSVALPEIKAGDFYNV